MNPLVRTGLTALNVVTILFVMFPIVAAAIASLQSELVLSSDLTAILPAEYTLDNYRILFGGTDEANRAGTIYANVAYLPDAIRYFDRALLNSLIISSSVTALTISFSALSAYTVARLRLRWLLVLLACNVFARFVPLVVLVIPLYVIFRDIGLTNSLLGIIIAQTGFLLPFGVLILSPYFADIPRDIEEAARIDGCSRFGSFLKITLPLSGPILVSLGTIIFIASWNDLLIPLILSSKQEFMTVPAILVSLIGDNAVFLGLLCACCLVALLPTVLMVLMLQRYVVSGLTAGAVKA
ncbi:carbohydrate ABC transporter permease [Jiella avicenniae]|uniref:Carbohydrate ABC transporter permease n=1 Tax=Jiella avicenniae TaxID=2907202 RepID=A0A9X1P269_9HYPH|nr:carbohydrate ABC transporter permease [Jiella avicenniae]MCE7029687.1 carbohydrate ABC transporter permease [Jiella avicenniae]